MPKNKIAAEYIPRFVLMFCLIVSLGVLVSSLSCLQKNKPVSVPAETKLDILTDKAEYLQGEEVKIDIKNDTKNEVFLTFPSIEEFKSSDKNLDGGKWKAIRIVWAGCGVTGGLPYLPLDAGKSYTYLWDQKEKWCVGEPWEANMDYQEARPGKYRVKSAIVSRTKSAEEDPNNISGQLADSFIYSNEFTIKEKIAIDARCGKKAEFGSCRGSSEGYEFDLAANKCVKKLTAEYCVQASPFNSLEECQDICEVKTDFNSCTADSECVPVRADCCGCNAGGKAAAINKKFIFEWNKQPSCAGIMCPAVMSNDPSCSGVPKCVNNKCEIINAEDKQNI